MANTRSFTEYVAKTFDNQFWAAAETYLRENIETLDIELYKFVRLENQKLLMLRSNMYG